MAAVNNTDDQKERSWGEKLRKMFDMEVKKPKPLTDDETVKLLKKRNGRA